MDANGSKIILIRRKTRLQELVARYNTVLQAKFYVEHMGADFGEYIEEDSRYKEALLQAQTALDPAGIVQVVDREFVPNFLFGQEDIVVALGQDGLVANTMKYLDSQPLIGINPDPTRYDGVLLPFKVSDLQTIVTDVQKGRRHFREVSMAKASLNDGQTLHAVNDLFIGQKTHVSARYRLCTGELEERQSSSGIIISTGLGSTGWMKSVLTGALGILNILSGSNANVKLLQPPWNADYLYFSVREPFPSRITGTSLTFGKITKAQPLKIESHMAEGGVIFSDGMEQDFLSFNAGLQVTVTVSEKVGKLVV